jgi:hypothetical protein
MRRTIVALLLAAAVLAPTAAPADDHLLRDFRSYAETWVQDLNAHLLHGEGRARCIQPTGGGAVARYRAVDPSSLEVSVTPPSKGGAPAAGILRYTEIRYASRGDGCEQAEQGPFQAVSRRRIMELFVRSRGKWRPGPPPGLTQ